MFATFAIKIIQTDLLMLSRVRKQNETHGSLNIIESDTKRCFLPLSVYFAFFHFPLYNLCPDALINMHGF